MGRWDISDGDGKFYLWDGGHNIDFYFEYVTKSQLGGIAMAKDIVGAYRNVCRDLIGLQAYEPISRRTLEQAHRTVYMGKAPSSMMCYVPLDKALEAYNYAVDDYNETTKTIDQLIGVKVQLEKVIANMTEAEQIIVIMHVEQGKNLREIAEISHYSYGHLKNVSRRMKHDVTESANAS